MSKITKIENGGSSYGIIETSYKDVALPILIDWGDAKYIKKMNRKWRCNSSGLVSTSVKKKDKTKSSASIYRDVFLHDVIMMLHDEEASAQILHLNRIGLDNRFDNLKYNITDDGEPNRNTIKKKRTIKLPKESGIDPDDLPTYVWYMKPNGSHGERFWISIGEYQWKTTSAKGISLNDKLEEAKDHLRLLKEIQPELFEEYCMNGEFTAKGKKLCKTFYSVVHLAGYTYLEPETIDHVTSAYIDF
jgi:hypothetical protein